jgi:peptidoglycan-associated lipoprotein
MRIPDRRVLATICVVFLSLSVAGCRKKAITPAPEPAIQTAVDQTPPRPVDDDAARRAADAERAERERADRERAEREAATRARTLLAAPVYFDFDRSDLTADARTQLDDKLIVLRDDPSFRVRIEGHTDVRGSDEYNMALGMRRAAAVRRYFTQRGIDENRIEIVSMGEERQTCYEPGEMCWRLNRRAEFFVILP